MDSAKEIYNYPPLKPREEKYWVLTTDDTVFSLQQYKLHKGELSVAIKATIGNPIVNHIEIDKEMYHQLLGKIDVLNIPK